MCVVTVLNDEGGLPERLRVAWSKLRFPDARRLRQGLNEGGVRVCDMLAQLLADQVREFYAHKHRDSLDRLIVTRDICQQRVSDIEAEVPPAQMRQRAYARARARARAHTHTHTHRCGRRRCGSRWWRRRRACRYTRLECLL